MAGGGPSGNTNSTQTNQPWSGELPFLTQVYGQASSDFNNTSQWPQYYGGTQVAPFNPTENAALAGEADLGLTGNSSVNAGNGFLTSELSGNYLPENNPYLHSMIDSSLSSVLPGIESQFAEGNAMNEPGAAFATGQGVGNAIGNVEGGMFQQDLQDMNNAASWGAPAMQQADWQNLAGVFGAGQQAQSQQQQEINADISKWNYNQTLPLNMLDYYNSLIDNNNYDTSTLTSPYFQPSPMAGALGGAASGAMLGSAFGPWGTLAGGAIGGLVGGLS